MNLLNRITDIENQLVVAKQEGLGSADISFYTEWINRVLLYSTENSQCSVINHNGKEYFFKMYVHV